MKVTTIPVMAALCLGAVSAMPQENALAAAAASNVAGPIQETYGTGSLVVYDMPSANFSGRDSAVAYGTFVGIERFITSASGILEASPNLPSGAQIERIELRACDRSSTEVVRLTLQSCPVNGDACDAVGDVDTGATASPGCSNFPLTLAAPVVVDNQATPLSVLVRTGTTAVTTFSAVKLYYRLRVSPSPAVATFPNDVPTTHVFFRYIEALASAGITGGCGAGSYCPDAPVTRGQMATFLSVALGLHFPN